MKREFKPGDKVKLRDDLTVKEMEDPEFGLRMLDFYFRKGELTVETVLYNRVEIEGFGTAAWKKDWLELVTPVEEYKEYTVEELEERLGEKIKIKGKVK